MSPLELSVRNRDIAVAELAWYPPLATDPTSNNNRHLVSQHRCPSRAALPLGS
jgi:hypothetical protein